MKALSICLSILFFITTLVYTAEDVKKLRRMGKKALVQMAVERVRDIGYLEFDAEYYDRIRVLANKEEILVTFGQSILYLPYHSSVVSSVTVHFGLSRSVSMSIRSNPEDFEAPDDPTFSISDTNNVKAYILQTFVSNRYFAPEFTNHIPDNLTMEIYDELSHFYVVYEDLYTSYRAHIDKTNGMIVKSWHKHFQREPTPKSPYREIKR